MKVSRERETKETSIKLTVGKGTGESSIDTGVGFLDHMLTLFAFHSGLEIDCRVEGDTHIDDHHTTEDTGIVLGQLLKELIGDKAGIRRYGVSYVPMDETLTRTVVDISGRPFFVYDAVISREKVGTFDTELAEEFFRAVVINAGLTVHMDLIRGGNAHHEIESFFKSFARALREAMETGDGRLPSTKGVL
ncbi:imidazoleglycerol-phosphate dehydratase HisB [Indiicoccus explosivorum]|uniref:imidazoleglycerol-phosphate dehydratase HisB n=1 Tax=Indiicoccus explosivorum TaxID=1917864 RepID=UPI000B431AD4|nr:imidazoleglycerol-phosphate dehydratase HisB [Indiicoccus explosivorum]